MFLALHKDDITTVKIRLESNTETDMNDWALNGLGATKDWGWSDLGLVWPLTLLIVTRDEVEDSNAEEFRVLITKLNKRTKTTPKGKNKQAGRRLEHSQTFNSHDMDTRKTTDQNRTADTRRLYRETNEGNEGDTAGATETMIK